MDCYEPLCRRVARACIGGSLQAAGTGVETAIEPTQIGSIDGFTRLTDTLEVTYCRCSLMR
jgi:hypothetical protein